MSDVTQLLSQIESGNSSASERLLPLVYDELRKLAGAKMVKEKPGQTLQATALVHDAYIRLVDVEKAQHWNSRGHFFRAAAEAMRRILIEQARRKGGHKAGGSHQRVELSQVDLEVSPAQIDFLDLNEALNGLERHDSRASQVVKLRFFAGMNRQQTADLLGISLATADNDWAYAKSWLQIELEGSTRAVRQSPN